MRCIVVALLVLHTLPLAAQADSVRLGQRDLRDVALSIFGRHPASDSVVPLPQGRLEITALPILSADPARGFRFGISGNAVERLGPPETTTLSQLGVAVSYSTKGQFAIAVPSSIFFRGDRFGLVGDWRYLDMSEPTYGLGPFDPARPAAGMSFGLLRVYETALIPVGGHVFVAPGYRLDLYHRITDSLAAATGASPYLDYNGGVTVTRSTSSGATLGVVYESRDNPINPTRGFFGSAFGEAYRTWLGSDEDWEAVRVDLRAYRSLARQGRTVLGAWLWSWITFGPTPYLALPAIGWDFDGTTGRGYVEGQMRGPGLLYGEVELRQQVTRNGLLGATAFLNLSSFSEPTTRRFTRVDPGYGVGLRFKLNKFTGTNVGLDVGFDRTGVRNVYLISTEAF